MIDVMTVLPWLLVIVGQGQTPPRTAPFSDGLLNLQFERPAEWKPGPPPLKKGQRPAKDTIFFTVPIKDSKEVAYLELVRTSFSGKIETWQSVQAEAFNQTKREVVRQWQQDILNVPMLFTKGVGIDGSTPRTYVAGLMYVRGPYKMLVKLNAPSAVFDQVNSEVLASFESLRTIDGTALEIEDPNRKFDPKEWKNRTRIQKPIVLGGATTAPSNAAAGVPFEVANRKLLLKVPTGIKATIVGTKARIVGEAGVELAVIDFYSTLDSESPKVVISQHAAKSLEAFSTVSSRVDTDSTNQWGCQTQSYCREGIGPKGNQLVFAAVFGMNEAYGVLSFSTTDSAKGRAQRQKVLAFLDKVSIDVAK